MVKLGGRNWDARIERGGLNERGDGHCGAAESPSQDDEAAIDK